MFFFSNFCVQLTRFDFHTLCRQSSRSCNVCSSIVACRFPKPTKKHSKPERYQEANVVAWTRRAAPRYTTARLACWHFIEIVPARALGEAWKDRSCAPRCELDCRLARCHRDCPSVIGIECPSAQQSNVSQRHSSWLVQVGCASSEVCRS